MLSHICKNTNNIMARLDTKFLLRFPNKEEPSEIRLRLNYEYRCFIYPLIDPLTLKVYKILPCLWDNNAQRPISEKEIPRSFKDNTTNNSSIKSMVNKLKVAVTEALDYARVNGISLSNHYLKEQLDVKMGRREKKKIEELTLCTFYRNVIEEMKNGTLLTDSTEKYGTGTIKCHRRTFLLLKELDFAKDIITRFENIDNLWYDDFIQFLTQL